MRSKSPSSPVCFHVALQRRCPDRLWRRQPIEQTSTVSELNKQTARPNVFARILNNSPSPIDRVKESLNRRNTDLLQNRTTAKSFVDAASEIASKFRQSLTANVRTDIATGNEAATDITRPNRPDADDHLKQTGQTTNRVSLQQQTGAINEAGIGNGGKLFTSRTIDKQSEAWQPTTFSNQS